MQVGHITAEELEGVLLQRLPAGARLHTIIDASPAPCPLRLPCSVTIQPNGWGTWQVLQSSCLYMFCSAAQIVLVKCGIPLPPPPPPRLPPQEVLAACLAPFSANPTAGDPGRFCIYPGPSCRGKRCKVPIQVKYESIA